MKNQSYSSNSRWYACHHHEWSSRIHFDARCGAVIRFNWTCYWAALSSQGGWKAKLPETDSCQEDRTAGWAPTDKVASWLSEGVEGRSDWWEMIAITSKLHNFDRKRKYPVGTRRKERRCKPSDRWTRWSLTFDIHSFVRYYSLLDQVGWMLLTSISHSRKRLSSYGSRIPKQEYLLLTMKAEPCSRWTECKPVP